MSRRRKKRKHEDGHIDESWLLPYSDLLTLLLALFIVLFASSSSDSSKTQQMSDVFNEIFTNKNGIMDESSPYAGDTVAEAAEKIIKEDQLEKQAQEDLQKPLREIQQQMKAYIAENKLEKSLETNLTDDGLIIRIKSEVLFASGKAELKDEQLLIAQSIAKNIVSPTPVEVIVSGHTDNVPINNAQFSSNLQLSLGRATNFMQALSQNEQLKQNIFSVKGYGEQRPIASNDTEEGRAANRRVEIFISPMKGAATNEQQQE
jgi:chemotaxis protein MotB